MEKIKYSQLTYKEKVSYCTCIASFILGWVLLFAGFIVPPTGELTASVITAFGMALTYSGSILGIAIYFNNQMAEFKSEINKKLNKNESSEINS